MGRFEIWKWMVDQWSSIPSVSSFRVDLTGKTVIVTGANVGIGLEAARHLATMNPSRLIIGCRSAQKADAAIEAIRDSTGYKSVEFWSLDLANFSSVRAFADRFEKEGGGQLDLLVQNAGMFTSEYEATADGWENMLQINHLAPSLLALLLLPFLLESPRSSPTPRLVIVSSEGHLMIQSFPESKEHRILERLNDKQYCTRSVMTKRYFVSKLLTVFFTRSLASRLPPPPTGSLTVNCVNPGFCRSELGRQARGILWAMKWLIESIFARTPEVGSRNLLWAALGGEGGEVHGRYISNCKIEDESDLVLSNEGSEIEDRLWAESIEILSKVDPRVKQITESLWSQGTQ